MKSITESENDVPGYTPGPAERAKTAASGLLREFIPASGSIAIVMDD